MFTVLVVLAVLIGVLLTLIVIVQNSKGGGLASQFAASNSVMGVQKTTDFLEKATWSLTAIMVVLCVASAAFINRGHAVDDATAVRDAIEQAAPAAPQSASPIMAAEPAAAE